jgi:hypothetical protein
MSLTSAFMRYFLLSSAVVLALSGMAPVAAQQPASARWTADPKTGCKVWNPHPQPRETVSWDGPCKGGIANGSGVTQWLQDGNVLGRTEAEHRNGRAEGRGLSFDRLGNRIEGEFVGGQLNGRGILTGTNGNRIIGNFVNGKMQGRAVIHQTAGPKIDADMVDDVAVRGVITSPDGSRYEGELKNLMRHGQGKLQFKGNVVYEGSFVDNSIEGYGTILYSNGTRYEGQWFNYQPHGRGTSRINGVLNSGIWVHGCLSQANSDRGLQATLIASLAACGFQ